MARKAHDARGIESISKMVHCDCEESDENGRASGKGITDGAAPEIAIGRLK